MSSSENAVPSRPVPLDVKADGIPAELKSQPRWVGWRYVYRPNAEKPWTKVPINCRTGGFGSSTNSNTWSTFEEALDLYRKGQADGIGIVVSGSGLTGIDFDDCRDAMTGDIHSAAAEIMNKVRGYWEVSPSGRGLRGIITGKLPPGGRSKGGQPWGGKAELFDNGRYLTVSGHVLRTDGLQDNQTVQLAEVHASIFGEPGIVSERHGADPTEEDDSTPATCDATAEELLERLREAGKLSAKTERLLTTTGTDPDYKGTSETDCALAEMLLRAGLNKAETHKLIVSTARGRDGLQRHAGKNGKFPDWWARTVHAAANHIEQTGSSKRRGGTDRVQELLKLADEALIRLFHTPAGETFASVPVGNRRENYSIHGEEFPAWLRFTFYKRTSSSPAAQALKTAVETLHSRAVYEAPEHRVHLRVAGHDGLIYLDLADVERRAAEVGPTGWRIVNNPPVHFERPMGMTPLPEPQRGGSLFDLRRFVNVNDEQWPLLLGWLVFSIRPTGPYPILHLVGPPGTAKSTSASALKSLVDPNACTKRRAPANDRDFAVAARHNWVLLLDNLSRVPDWLNDALCTVSTGGALAVRKLYTNDSEFVLAANHAAILTSIREVVTRSDALERCLSICPPEIADQHRRDETTFWAEYESARPKILGALLDAVSAALRNLPMTATVLVSRLADFVRWGTAAEPALPIKPGEFAAACAVNRLDHDQQVLEQNPVASAIIQMMGECLKNGQRTWSGTSKGLLAELNRREFPDPKAAPPPGWPRTPVALSNIVRHIVQNLRRLGVAACPPQGKTGHKRDRIWTLESVPVAGGESAAGGAPTTEQNRPPAAEDGDLAENRPCDAENGGAGDAGGGNGEISAADAPPNSDPAEVDF